MDKIKKIAEIISAGVTILTFLGTFIKPDILKMDQSMLNYFCLLALAISFAIYRWRRYGEMKEIRAQLAAHTQEIEAVKQAHQELIIELDQYLGGVSLKTDEYDKKDSFQSPKYGTAANYQTVNVYNILYRTADGIETHLRRLYELCGKDVPKNLESIKDISKIRGQGKVMPASMRN